tara:strand:+ start:244 stop:390 length:147 start_codon:yes stop_codon:yes gene_type:complete
MYYFHSALIDYQSFTAELSLSVALTQKHDSKAYEITSICDARIARSTL